MALGAVRLAGVPRTCRCDAAGTGPGLVHPALPPVLRLRCHRPRLTAVHTLLLCRQARNRRSSWAPTVPDRFWSAWTAPPPRSGLAGMRRAWRADRGRGSPRSMLPRCRRGWRCPPPPARRPPAGEADERTAEDMRRRAEEFSREFGVPIAFMAVRGDPFTELRRVADDIRADAVVVGASAHAGHRLVEAAPL